MITLATLPNASLQDIFTQARDHLLKQNCRSRTAPFYQIGNKKTTCAYRGTNGTMCAVGCFISDEEYKPEMDLNMDTSVTGLMTQGLFPILEEQKVNLLAELQYLHDTKEPHNWTEALLEIAISLELEWV